MPKGPQGQKRPADVIGNAVHVVRVAEIRGNGNPERKSEIRGRLIYCKNVDTRRSPFVAKATLHTPSHDDLPFGE